MKICRDALGAASSMLRVAPASATLPKLSLAEIANAYGPSTPAGASSALSMKVKKPPSNVVPATTFVPDRSAALNTPVGSVICAVTVTMSGAPPVCVRAYHFVSEVTVTAGGWLSK